MAFACFSVHLNWWAAVKTQPRTEFSGVPEWNASIKGWSGLLIDIFKKMIKIVTQNIIKIWISKTREMHESVPVRSALAIGSNGVLLVNKL